MIFSHRSYQKELLDEDGIPFADIKQNMQELDFINKWLGGHKITINAFKYLSQVNSRISVCEIGCGGGDNLAAINKWCTRKILNLTLPALILNRNIDYARSRKGFVGNVKWITSDYKKVFFDTKPDIIFSSLFCHHFINDELIFQINWMKQNCATGFFINDLQRHFLAYYSIKFLTSFFSKSYLVKNDAPLSVARGFRKKELKELCGKAKVYNAEVSWKWAFRYIVIFKHEPGNPI